MSSLYRCRARVGYRPFGSDKLILFDEKQIQELNVKLKWKPGLGSGNADRSTEASGITNILNQSTCSVTISDPYLTGAAWPVLYDAASLYSQSNVAAANNILLPPCDKGQDPNVDKCVKYVDVEGDKASGLSQQNFAFLVLSLWYDVKGTSFGTDFYFRVNGFSVSHGTKYPSVTIRGVEARSVLFNQSLINTTLEEGLDVDEALKKLAEQLGYAVSFCANTNSDPTKKRLLPRSVRYTGVTTEEAIKKVLDSVGGNMLSMPTREWANKVSMCSRGEVEQGCSVFYLGKGLYEGYEIAGQPELTLLGKNYEQGSNRNNADPYVSEAFKANTYFIGDMVPKTRKKSMEKVKKVTFPELFKPVPKHVKGAPTTTGYVWRDQSSSSANKKGIQVINEEASKLQADGMNLFGIAPNGTTAISFLSGIVQEADEKQGRVVIKSNFSLQICEKEGSQKCFFRPIMQESTGLSSVKVKAKDKLDISQEIGSATSEKPEFVRLYIMGHNGKHTTLNPKIVWDWAFPETEVPRTESPQVNSGSPQSSAPAPQSTSGEIVIGRIGSTGSSSGPHLHAEWADRRPITAEQVREFVKVPGIVTSPYNDPTRSRHLGVDIGGNDRAPISIYNGASVASVGETKCTVENVRTDRCGGGSGNYVTINTPKGQMILAHLAPQSIPPTIAGLSTSSGGGKTNQTIQSSPSIQGLTIETSFKGVPRALRIIPGRTILSFITDYDAWIDEGGPRGQANGTDPGVWIPNRFKNWFITECQYRWREGDLRVEIEGINAWGTSRIPAPNFDDYLASMKKSGDLKNANNYYDYIRSLGGLNWKLDNGKDSTEEICNEAIQLSATYDQAGGDTTNPTDVQSSFPPVKCQYTGSKYPSSRVNAIINAAGSAGIKTKAGYAGVVGNALVESGIALSPTAENPTSKAYGVFQWLGGRRTGLERYAASRGKSASDFGVQMERFAQELNGADFQGKATVQALNSTNDPSRAAAEFNRLFERAPGQKETERQQYAQEIFSQLNCA